METSGVGGGGVSLGGLLLRLDAGVTRRVELAGGEKDWVDNGRVLISTL